ncbi:hypothetical protein KC359_g9 [Hortaea werneckii]|nr:hypothetical protein KC359_g9 [Hortaea werneckii]
MATPLRTRALRPSLFHLPPALRVSAFQATTAQRSFSSTSPPFTLVDIAVTPPSYLLDLLHNSLGLPWYAVLPATALIVRSSLLYFFSSRNDRRKQGLRATLSPVIAARVTRQLNNPEAVQKSWRTLPFLRPLFAAFRAYFTRRAESRTLEKQFGISQPRGGGFVSFGVLIAVTEAVRMRREWRGRGNRPRIERGSAPRRHGHRRRWKHTTFILPTSLVLIIASGIVFRPGQSLSKPPPFSPPSAKPSAAAPLPPSSSPTEHQPPPIPSTPPYRLLPRITNLQRLQLSILFPFWLAALQFPAATVLYIASSSAITQFQKLWVYRKMMSGVGGGAAAGGIQPCRRPLRLKVRKEWINQ